jgi:RNA polymerase sigma-70 factor (TIGR02957 family)
MLDPLSAFLTMRPRLLGIAYRMLGSAAEAEDVVQDVWLRWHGTDHTTVLDPPAFLATATTRLAINVSQSARVRRETYVGPWLPEPIDTTADPAFGAERDEALHLAVLVLLEKLTPTERAAYVLREAFDYEYAEIAQILQLTEGNVRQLVTRARKHVASNRRAPVTPAEQRRLLEAFVAAAQQGDVSALEGLLAEDVVSLSDGGGAVRAARIPVLGRTRVARFIAAFAPHFWTGTTVVWRESNGQPSALISRDGAPVAVASIDASADGIGRVFWIMNPAKIANAASPPTP